MNSNVSIFLVKLLLYSVIITGISYAVYLQYPNALDASTFLMLQAFVVFVTAASHISLLGPLNNKQQSLKFVNRFMAVTMLKLFVYIGGLAGYIIVKKYLLHAGGSYVNFAVTFVVLYALYAIFEVILIMKFIKQNQDTSN